MNCLDEFKISEVKKDRAFKPRAFERGIVAPRLDHPVAGVRYPCGPLKIDSINSLTEVGIQRRLVRTQQIAC